MWSDVVKRIRVMSVPESYWGDASILPAHCVCNRIADATKTAGLMSGNTGAIGVIPFKREYA
jgi:hypothetical protein